jgi:hypothetical protein
MEQANPYLGAKPAVVARGKRVQGQYPDLGVDVRGIWPIQ